MNDRKENRLTLEQWNDYGMPIRNLIRQNKMALMFDDDNYSDNASMAKFNLLSTDKNTTLYTYKNAFEPLELYYPKLSIETFADKISITIPKRDEDRQTLTLKKVLGSEDYKEFIRQKLEKDEEEEREGIYFALGETVDNQIIIEDLKKCVHLLLAGATGSGKSVCLHTIINSLMYLYTPSQLRFVMFDMKAVELSFYEESKYLLEPICTDAKEAYKILGSLINEMEKRYNLIHSYGKKTIEGYNSLSNVNKMPYIVVVIDEYADLILTNKEVDEKIQKLAQKSRACGIHLIISTQQPKAEVVTSIIKANMNTRLSFRVADGNASRIILDDMGAEILNDNGDMLIKTAKDTTRLQCAYLSEDDIMTISEELINKFGKNDFAKKRIIPKEDTPIVQYVRKIEDGETKDNKTVLEDNAFMAATHAIQTGRASRVMFKKFLGVGDNKSNSILSKLINYGIIGEYDEKTQTYPISIDLEALEKSYISVSEANV